MPATSSSKKADPNQNKKVDVTPVRISSRVRKEKFSVKELFSSKDKDISSDDEVVPKKRVAMTPTTSKISNVQVVKASTSKSDSAKINKTIVAKPTDTKTKILSLTPKTLSNLGKAEIKTGILRKSSVQTTPKTSLLKKPTDVTTPKINPKLDENYDQIIADSIKLEPIFNQDNIEAVLENPSAVGLDIVVTKLSESDHNKEHESKKCKNVVTIAKVQGSQPASKPFKVVPMKPSTPDPKADLKTSPTSILKTPLNSSLIIEKKKVNQTSSQVKEVKVNRSLGTDVLDKNTRMVEKKRQVKPLDTKYDKSDIFKSNKRSLLISDNLRHVQEESEKRLKELRGDIDEDKINPYDFEKYFTVSESYIEHNDSLDEESNDEDNYLSHFFEKESSAKRPRHSEGEEFTIPELMYQVNTEFPSWNLHSMQDNSFLICQVTRGSQGLPLMSKMIEINSDLNLAKIYINQILHKEINGSYDNYESIRQLISSVQ